MENVNVGFELALIGMRNGKKFARRNWNGKDMFVSIQSPDVNSKMTEAYIYMTILKGDEKRIPWVASQKDLLANDWFEFTGIAQN